MSRGRDLVHLQEHKRIHSQGESSAQQLRKLTQFAGRLAHFVQKRFARKLWFNDIKMTPF